LSDAAGEILGLVLANFADGDREASPEVIKLAIIRIILEEKRRHEAPQRECHATATTAEESQKNGILREKAKGRLVDLNPWPEKECRRQDLNLHDLAITRPSTWRVFHPATLISRWTNVARPW